MNLSFRPADGHGTEDRAFLVSTWSRSFKSSHYAGVLWDGDYAAIMHAQIERVLDRPETTALIACEKGDPEMFYGHIVGEVDRHATPIVHYVYVKEPYRRWGIARGLLNALGINPLSYFVVTARTRIYVDPEIGPEDILRVLGSKIPRARFDPNGIRYSKANRRRAL